MLEITISYNIRYMLFFVYKVWGINNFHVSKMRNVFFLVKNRINIFYNSLCNLKGKNYDKNNVLNTFVIISYLMLIVSGDFQLIFETPILQVTSELHTFPCREALSGVFYIWSLVVFCARDGKANRYVNHADALDIPNRLPRCSPRWNCHLSTVRRNCQRPI